MSRTVFLTLALLALVCSVSAHAGHNKRGGMPYGWRNSRAVEASTCSYFQCAVSGGSCDPSASRYCPAGEHCAVNANNGKTCATNVALGSTCNPNSLENECAQGSCITDGNGASTCQLFRELMPGTPCESDTQCFYAESSADTIGSAGTCDATTKLCRAQQVGQTCIASHQCVVGSFCSTTDNVCKTLSTEGQMCASEDECDSRFSCLGSVCTRRYSRAAGQACDNTNDCQSGLYCSTSKVCSKVSAVPSSKASCDITSNNCAANEECSCVGYTTAGQTATCNAIKGSYSDMATIENSAYSCLAASGCNLDTNNATNVACIAKNCKPQFCTYFTRHVNEMYSEYPECLVARMVASIDYFGLVKECNVYAPKDAPANSGSLVSASFALMAIAIFFFTF